jgi:hypothetical protein
MSAVQEFEQYLKENAVKWSETLATEIGIRIVYITGELLRTVIARGDTAKLWDAMKEGMPADVMLVNLWDEGRLAVPKVGMQTYCDAWGFIFGSKEWEPLKADGAEIPELQITVKPLYELAGASK